MSARRHDVLPPTRLALAVRDEIARHSGRAAAARVGVSPATLARIAARLPGSRPITEFVARRLGIDLDEADNG